ncbi:MAG: Ribonuclease HII [Turneriella sp.]|nr:Ribonuclease HII [Turneriella sp.]
MGRGALFGPVAVGAVLLTKDGWRHVVNQPWAEKVRDSKLLNEAKRENLAPVLRQHLPCVVVHTAVLYIDRYNISRAVDYGIYKAVQILLSRVKIPVERVHAIFDGKTAPRFPQLRLQKPMPHLSAKVKADRFFFPVAAASVIAKVERDRLIKNAAQRFPKYGLENHVGYATAEHREAIERLGQTKFHRKSFRSTFS